MTHASVEHLIVLMLENRSFDHMLGYLEYPPGVPFEGLRGKEHQFGNPVPFPDGEVVFPGPGASYSIFPGPHHGHTNVMRQMTGKKRPVETDPVHNKGYASDFSILPHEGEKALKCFTPDKLPILATLAQEFAVCDHWFCSVPGATWPNRNFAHAGTSDGEVDINTRVNTGYTNPTIFEQLSKAGRDWAIYYGGFPPQSIAFANLWRSRSTPSWLQRFKPIANLYRAIRSDRLPQYAFVEPDMLGRTSDSQHPDTGGEMDFRAAERLVWRLYSALQSRPAVFRKTLLLITYDEHGGFFDHVVPPRHPSYSLEPFYSPFGYQFRFDLLGPRVPAVLVSPWIERGTVDQTVYDHASIPATARKLLGVDDGVSRQHLTHRDEVSNTFDGVLARPHPRRSLPRLVEPFVDQSVRTIPQDMELRESLLSIIKEMIWNNVSTAGSLSIGSAGEPLEPTPLVQPPQETPEQAQQALLSEIGAQLSPEARQVIQEADFSTVDTSLGAGQDFLDPLSRWANIARQAINRLMENQEIIDDVMRVADWFLRKLEPHHLVLRTHDGESLEILHKEAMDLERVGKKLEALFEQPDANACLWVADHQDRWLSFYASRRVTFQDAKQDRVVSLGRAEDIPDALRRIQLLKDGKVQALKRTSRAVRTPGRPSAPAD